LPDSIFESIDLVDRIAICRLQRLAMSRPSKSKPSKTAKLTQRTDHVLHRKPHAQITSERETQRKTIPKYKKEDDRDLVSVTNVMSRGPSPAHRKDIFLFRDQLVMLIEWFWPEILQACALPLDEKFLLQVLSAIKLNVPCEASAHLVTHIDKLIKFLNARSRKPPHTRRFCNDPRQLANATAGEPLIGFWTSMRKCELKANRCESAIGQRAIRSYIERKHRPLALLLREVKPGDILGYRAALKDYDLRDSHIVLCRKPTNLQRAWEAGLPNWTALGLGAR
jgi:hypothetical protein